MKLFSSFLLAVALCLAALAQSPATPAKTPVTKATPAPTPTAVKLDPLNLTEAESASLDKNQQQNAALKREAERVNVQLSEAADKIATAKNADAMAAAGYQMRDALNEQAAYQRKLAEFQQETETLVTGIRQRYKADTGQDCAECKIDVTTKRLQPPEPKTANVEASPGATKAKS